MIKELKLAVGDEVVLKSVKTDEPCMAIRITSIAGMFSRSRRMVTVRLVDLPEEDDDK